MPNKDDKKLIWTAEEIWEDGLYEEPYNKGGFKHNKQFLDLDLTRKELEEIYKACNEERVFEIQNRLAELLKKLK